MASFETERLSYGRNRRKNFFTVGLRKTQGCRYIKCQRKMQPFITKGCFSFLFVDKEWHFTKPVEHSLQQVYNANEKIMKEEKPMTKQGKEMDMLQGKLSGKLILFALPLAFSSILQQLFNSADVAVVGRFAGGNALAAVGSCVALVGIFVNLIVGLSVGPNAALASLIGQKKRRTRSRKCFIPSWHLVYFWVWD